MRLILSITVCIGISCHFSCGEPVRQEDLVREAIAIRIDKWRLDQHENCRKKTIEKADQYVDSFLLANSLMTKLDTIPKPAKPVKPIKPPLRDKPDSVTVKQILKEDD